MVDFHEIVQDAVLYVTVILGVLLYVSVLWHRNDDSEHRNRRYRNLTLALIGVITMIFGVGFLHQLLPQRDGLWFPILGILIVAVGWILIRLRTLTPKVN